MSGGLRANASGGLSSDSPHPNPSPEGEGLQVANAARGEASIVVGGETLVLRPSFEALVAAEEELGPLFALVERAASGGLRISEVAALFWFCLRAPREGVTRERVGEAVAEMGLVRVSPVLRVLLGQILQGR